MDLGVEMLISQLFFDNEMFYRFEEMTQIAGILDSPFTIMDYYENQRHVLTSVDYYNQMQQSINLLTSQRISELADKYLDINEFRISIAGNPNNKV